MKQLIFPILLLVASAPAWAQNVGWSEDDNISNRQLGLKLGVGQFTMFGGELQNPRLKTGFQAGFFLFGEKTEKRLNWQTGLELAFLGGNFANTDSGNLATNTVYTQLGIIQVEIPLLCNIRLRKSTDKRYESLQIGLIPAGIVNSVIYTGWEKIPQQQSNLRNWKNLPLNPFNLQAAIGYQFRGGLMGYSFRMKASILDLNDNFVLPGLLPATGTGKRIGTVGAELSFLF